MDFLKNFIANNQFLIWLRLRNKFGGDFNYSNYQVKSAKVQKKVKAFKVLYSFKELQTHCHLISKSKQQIIKKVIFPLGSNENFNLNTQPETLI